MTERDLFIQEIPKIAEMTVRSREMSNEQYEQWKKESLEQAEFFIFQPFRERYANTGTGRLIFI